MEKYRKNISILKPFAYIVVCICFSLYGCSPQSLHEAQTVVCAADSLRAEGQLYTDSVKLAEAYETLDKWQVLYPDDYAHACYHYGRLLRSQDNPVAAMQVFINATHSRTHDYHILGRVFNNMGDLVHLAGDFPLSYKLFEQSAEMFLHNRDTILYYYAVYRMAYEKAELADSTACMLLLQNIKDIPETDQLIVMTKAELYTKCQQYDSAIYYANILQDLHYYAPQISIIKARAFSRLGLKDSAIIYAKSVLSDTCSSFQDRFNALYVLSHNDTTLNREEIRAIASEREDIRYYEYEPQKEQWTNAEQLLTQDLTRKPDRRWVYIFVAVVLFISSCSILYYIWRKRRQHRRIVQELHEKKKVHTQLQKTITNLSHMQEDKHQQIQAEIENTCQLLHNSNDLFAELKWYNYEEMCTIVNLRMYGIISRLKTYSLSEKEVRLCVLILLQASTGQMVDMIPYAHSGLGKFKYTTARKLGTTTSNLRLFILNLMCQ